MHRKGGVGVEHDARAVAEVHRLLLALCCHVDSIAMAEYRRPTAAIQTTVCASDRAQSYIVFTIGPYGCTDDAAGRDLPSGAISPRDAGSEVDRRDGGSVAVEG